jgi:hypothetical protein
MTENKTLHIITNKYNDHAKFNIRPTTKRRL